MYFLQKPYPEDSPLYQEATPLKNEEVRKEEPKAPPVDLSSLEGLFGGGSVVKRK